MWNLLKFLVWTGLSVVLGVFLATHEIAGRTPVQHFQRAWKQSGASSKLDELRRDVQGAFEGAKDTVSTALDRKPKERHFPEEREAVNKLVAKRNEPK